jgi:hypothetical protein
MILPYFRKNEKGQMVIFLLTKQSETIIIKTGLPGEAGGNPARARRRKAQQSVLT